MASVAGRAATSARLVAIASSTAVLLACRFSKTATADLAAVLNQEFVGESLLKDILERMPDLEEQHPADYPAARAGLVDTVEKGLRQHGLASLDLRGHLRHSFFSRDEQLRLLTAQLETVREPVPDRQGGPNADDDLWQRGQALGALVELPGPQVVQGVPATELDGVRQVRQASEKLVSRELADFQKVMAGSALGGGLPGDPPARRDGLLNQEKLSPLVTPTMQSCRLIWRLSRGGRGGAPAGPG
ncbi:MAG: hypothetical protein HY319_13260 [Armatimonadetes bacterium]|nr:hypothetical protein [Armatimonadota bacterium]